ncbi:MAG: hypothetical protein HZB29_13950 [Nitrospinae bacterium]|nr:hypothetical protein [Nitrospinota bacterium]
MPIKDLVTDPGTGQMSHTKLWANIAYASSTGAFVYTVIIGSATADIWLIYLGIVGASATASKFLSLRYGAAPVDDPSHPPASPWSPDHGSLSPPCQGDLCIIPASWF